MALPDRRGVRDPSARGGRTIRAFSPDRRQLLKKLLFLGRKVFGNVDRSDDREIASLSTAKSGHSLPRDHEHGSGLGPGRNVEWRGSSVNQRYIELRPERCLGNAQSEPMNEICIVALEPRIRFDFDLYEQVTGRDLVVREVDEVDAVWSLILSY